jgi:hypothetical protein
MTLIARAAPILALFALACGGPSAAGSMSDTPVTGLKSTMELRVVIDLEVTADCDERFDLAVYEERGVDLITWDTGPTRIGRGCIERGATIRYMPDRISREALLRRIGKVSRKVVVLN